MIFSIYSHNSVFIKSQTPLLKRQKPQLPQPRDPAPSRFVDDLSALSKRFSQAHYRDPSGHLCGLFHSRNQFALTDVLD